jgi:hypothetical protein
MAIRDDLLDWQMKHYPEGHTTRVNLLIHLVSVPMFQGGCFILAMTPLVGWIGLFGLAGMLTAVIAQGRGHGLEPSKPIAFEGPLDVVSRLFVEQWVTFPRYLVSGGFVRAWILAGRSNAK